MEILRSTLRRLKKRLLLDAFARWIEDEDAIVKDMDDVALGRLYFALIWRAYPDDDCDPGSDVPARGWSAVEGGWVHPATQAKRIDALNFF
jgi:hypothetical protein